MGRVLLSCLPFIYPGSSHRYRTDSGEHCSLGTVAVSHYGFPAFLVYEILITIEMFLDLCL
jgi:uncharacterized protein with PQ loop repeat